MGFATSARGGGGLGGRLDKLPVPRHLAFSEFCVFGGVCKVYVVPCFAETGSYSELMARNGAFAALSRRQLLED